MLAKNVTATVIKQVQQGTLHYTKHLSSMYVDKSSDGASFLSLKVRHNNVQIGWGEDSSTILDLMNETVK